VSVSWNKTAPAPVALVNWVSFFFFFTSPLLLY
jgi:hypothetical protein